MYILFRGEKDILNETMESDERCFGCTEGKMASENKGPSQLNRESFEISIMI